MDHTESPVFSEPSAVNSVTIITEHDPLLPLMNLFSGASLDGRQYVEFTMTRSLADALHINQLNENCLLAIFNQFPLQEQLQLRAVCRQWQAIIEQKCRKMRSLKIFGGAGDDGWYCYALMALNLYGDDRYKLKPVGHDDDLIGSLDQLHQCAYLFADITTFVYEDMRNKCTILDQLPAMFPMLTSLTLCTISTFTVIRSLPHLTSLHLHLLNRHTIIPESIPILRQLECFSLHHYYGSHIASILSQLGPQLNRLMLSQVSFSAAQLATALTSNPSLVTSVTHLTIGDIDRENRDYPALLDLICSQFTNLVYLHFYSVDLHSLPFLAKLHHLTELHVDQFYIPDSIPRHLPAVSTVKQLHLEFNLEFYHIPTAHLNLQSLFPAVEQIAIYFKNDNELELAREYMAQFNITCPVSFQQKHFALYMGRNRFSLDFKLY